ncbi:hypothetical protein EYR38_006146 [Pleurotus pulmonarius]|nr:hypothetical protein EYR38_006146 [Pleurotus pulmonarius]
MLSVAVLSLTSEAPCNATRYRTRRSHIWVTLNRNPQVKPPAQWRAPIKGLLTNSHSTTPCLRWWDHFNSLGQPHFKREQSSYVVILILLVTIELIGPLRCAKSALLAANAINLLILFKDNDNFSGLPAGTCPPSLLILAYISVVTNTCATVTAMVVTDMINDLAYKSSWLVLFVSGFVITVAEILLFIATVEVKWVEITLFVVIIISAIFALLSMQLLLQGSQFMGTIDSPADTAFQILTYISLILNSSASTASIVLIDRIGELDFNSSSRPMESLPTVGWVNANAKSLLRLYGAGRSWMYVFYHWFASMLIGIPSFWAALVLMTWVHTNAAVSITVVCVAVFGILPLLCFLPYRAFFPHENTSLLPQSRSRRTSTVVCAVV